MRIASTRPWADDAQHAVGQAAPHRAGHSNAFESKELNKRIRAFITGWNDCCHPFI